MNIIFKAEQFATRKHAEINHVRKYTGEPYINHPKEVVEILKTVDHTDEMLAAAWMHDTVEDTNTTLDEIEAEFGFKVMVYVKGLTDVSKPEDGNREFRKFLDRKHNAQQLPCVMTIKLADLISNAYSIVERDPKFAKIYIAEMRLLLGVLREGDKTLWKRAYDIAYK
jgi:(p)ppGpp synthase/HD superfamily hydrolase